jgi:hypothetical protein
LAHIVAIRFMKLRLSEQSDYKLRTISVPTSTYRFDRATARPQLRVQSMREHQ